MLCTTAFAQQGFNIYYKIGIDYQEGNLNVSSVEIEFSKTDIQNPFGVYTAEILNYSGDTRDMIFFDVPKDIIYDNVDPETGEITGGGEAELEQVSFEIFVPYYEDAKEIFFYDGSFREIGKVDVSSFSKQRAETGAEIEEIDAGAGERILGEKNILDILTGNWWILALVLAVLIVVFLLSIRGKK